jgi:preprotein translocase subunit YajC
VTHLALILAPLLEQAASGSGTPPPGAVGACGGGGSSQMLVMMVIVFAIFYFLIIRPNQKRERERMQMLAALKPGDSVITAGGLVGRITGTSDRYVVMEISPKVRVRVLRSQVTGPDIGEQETQKTTGRKPKNKKNGQDKGSKTEESADAGTTKDA